LIVAASSPIHFTRLPPSHRLFIANDQDIVSALREGLLVFNADDRIKQIIDIVKTELFLRDFPERFRAGF
jgi:hypothetical protein